MLDIEDLKYAIACSTSFRGAAKMLKRRHSQVKLEAERAGIDTSHFALNQGKDIHVGRIYGRLTILKVFPVERTEPKRVHKRWYCECRCECNTICTKRLDGVVNGHVKTCGCSSFDQRDYWGANNPAFAGYGELPGHKVYELALGAKKRGLDFTVTKEYLWSLYEAQGRVCALTGAPIAFGKKGTDTSASLDRIDSKLSYVEGNVQWVHRLVNQMKWSIPQDQFIEICYLVTERNRRPSQIALSVEYSRSAR